MIVKWHSHNGLSILYLIEEGTLLVELKGIKRKPNSARKNAFKGWAMDDITMHIKRIPFECPKPGAIKASSCRLRRKCSGSQCRNVFFFTPATVGAKRTPLRHKGAINAKL